MDPSTANGYSCSRQRISLLSKSPPHQLSGQEFLGSSSVLRAGGARHCSAGTLDVVSHVSAAYPGTNSSVPFYLNETLGGADIYGNDTLRSYADCRFRGAKPHAISSGIPPRYLGTDRVLGILRSGQSCRTTLRFGLRTFAPRFWARNDDLRDQSRSVSRLYRFRYLRTKQAQCEVRRNHLGIRRGEVVRTGSSSKLANSLRHSSFFEHQEHQASKAGSKRTR